MLNRVWLYIHINDVHLNLHVKNLSLVIKLSLRSVDCVPPSILSGDVKTYPVWQNCSIGKRAREYYFVVTVRKKSEPTFDF